MYASIVFRAVVEADQRHDALRNADTDMQRDGAAFGCDAVSGRENIASFVTEQQSVEHRNRNRYQQY